MIKYKITWDTKKLKENGNINSDVSDFLEYLGAQIIKLDGSSVIVRTLKSLDDKLIGLKLRENFNLEFKIKEFF